MSLTHPRIPLPTRREPKVGDSVRIQLNRDTFEIGTIAEVRRIGRNEVEVLVRMPDGLDCVETFFSGLCATAWLV